MARQALGIAGGVIGAYFGGPYGAQIGFGIGSALGGFLDPPTVQGPSLGEAPVQTGRDGVPIPRGWGVVHTAGNIVQKNPAYEVETEESVGKGGGSTVVNVRRFRTFAIGICAGPIDGFLRIWENDKLVYDVRPNPDIPASETAAFAQHLTLYLGDDEQLPDPELETNWGVGTTPAFRGLAYIVWNNYDITDFASTIPTYRVEVEKRGYIGGAITSQPYAVVLEAGLELGISAPAGSMSPGLGAEAGSFTLAGADATLTHNT